MYLEHMKSKFIFLLVMSLIFLNCKKEIQKNTPSTSVTEEISLLDTLSLKLNNGDKWVVNKATQIGLNKMDSIINAFKTTKENDFMALGTSLSGQTSYIIKSCDMTGEAHDQLHVILVPMLDEIYVLKDSKDLEEMKNAVKNLEKLIGAYYKHFKN